MNTSPKILLIDDEPDLLHVVTLLLSTEGIEVAQASNGTEGLEKMSQKNYDLVVCDFQMPKMNGIQLLTKLREQGDYTSFIFFSGNADEFIQHKMMSLGAYVLLSKSLVTSLADVIHKTIKTASDLRNIRLDKTQEHKDFLKLLHSN